MKKTLLVLAAGLGSRYGGIKQIAPIGKHGEILLHYAIHDAVLAGFEKIVFIIKRSIEQDFKAAIGSYAEKHAEVAYAYQDEGYLPADYTLPANRTKMLGTVHALLSAKDLIAEPFAIVNADDYYGREAYAICAAQLDAMAAESDPHAACMVGYQLENTLSDNGTVNRGICNVVDGHLHSVQETYRILRRADGVVVDENGGEGCREIAADSIASMNFWGFLPSLFGQALEKFDAFLHNLAPEDITSEYVLTTLVDDLIQQDQLHVRVIPCSESWMGITYPTDREAVSNALIARQQAGFYPDPLQ